MCAGGMNEGSQASPAAGLQASQGVFLSLFAPLKWNSVDMSVLLLR